jgi:hypothetical protein
MYVNTIHVYTLAHACIYIYKHIHLHIHIYIYLCIDIYIYICLYTPNTYLASKFNARQMRQKAFANSPHLPNLDFNKWEGLLYLGNLVIFRHN